jgi:glycoside/pentoside/hexuronide:cation symporter, GPH family
LKMNARLLGVYGLGHYGKTVLSLASVLTFPFFLTEVVGIRPALMGQILALSLIFNAFCDLAIGSILKTSVTTPRQAGYAHAVGAVGASAALLAFSHAHDVDPALRTGYATTTLLLFRLCYSLFDVPQNSMAALVQGGDSIRSRMTAVRYVAGGSASLTIALFLVAWIPMVGPTSRSEAYGLLAVGLGGIAITTATMTAIFFRPTFETGTTNLPAVGGSFAIVPVMLSIVVYSGTMSIFTKLQPYFFAFVAQDAFEKIQFIALAAIGQIVSQPFWALLANRIALSRLYRIAALSLSVVGIAFLAVATAAGPQLLIVGVLFGAASSGTLMAIWSLMANVAAAPRATPLKLFGRFTFLSKSAQALGALGIGFILEGSGYRSPRASADIILWMGSAIVLTGCACAMASRFVQAKR